MPMMSPALELKKGWLIGEIGLVLLCLMPSQLIAYAKVSDRLLGYRATLITLSFVGVMTCVLPFCVNDGALVDAVAAVRSRPRFLNSFYLIVLAIVAIPGISAVYFFCKVGRGTPIPFDPPEKLVTTGVYAYCANPIQLSIALSLVVWGVYLENWVCLVISGMSLVYSAGIAKVVEIDEMEARFGEQWKSYKNEVKSWRFSILPPANYSQGRLFIARNCEVCSGIRQWFEKQRLTNLSLCHADEFQGETLERISYTNSGVRFEGVRAVAEAFQHINLLFASIGWVIHLPLISEIIQLAVDTSGGQRRSCKPSS